MASQQQQTNLRLIAGTLAVLLALAGQTACAGPIRDWFKERRTTQSQDEPPGHPAHSAATSLPEGVRAVRDVAYGDDGRQRFDVYLSSRAQRDAPVIFLVHGGAWRFGDKAARAVVENKVARWVPKGFVVVSANYRLLPQAAPLQQAEDVARALATAQDQAASWGGDRAKFILMGHSAGAHLVALLAATPAIAMQHGAMPWLGTIALDSAALDVVQLMEKRHLPLYDRAFGNDPAYWKAASPFQGLVAAGSPFLAVCSSQRDDSCPQAHRFAAKAVGLGMRASVLEQDLSHQDINERLGEECGYTEAVESFLAGLDDSPHRLLARSPTATR